MLELRVFVALFALNFNGKLAKDFDHDAFERSVCDRAHHAAASSHILSLAQLKDRFTMQKSALMVELAPRDH